MRSPETSALKLRSELTAMGTSFVLLLSGCGDGRSLDAAMPRVAGGLNQPAGGGEASEPSASSASVPA